VTRTSANRRPPNQGPSVFPGGKRLDGAHPANSVRHPNGGVVRRRQTSDDPGPAVPAPHGPWPVNRAQRRRDVGPTRSGNERRGGRSSISGHQHRDSTRSGSPSQGRRQIRLTGLTSPSGRRATAGDTSEQFVVARAGVRANGQAGCGVSEAAPASRTPSCFGTPPAPQQAEGRSVLVPGRRVDHWPPGRSPTARTSTDHDPHGRPCLVK